MDHAGQMGQDLGRRLASNGPRPGGRQSDRPGSSRRPATAGQVPDGGPAPGRTTRAQAAPAANGVQASLLTGAAWHKSSFSGPNGNCVEAADVPAGVAVRNSRFPDGPALLFTDAEWDAFLRGVKGGDFG